MCPVHKTYQPIVRNLTVDQKPARTSKDVIGHELKCGHKFGNKTFMKIQEVVNEINIEYAKRLMQLDEQRKENIAKAMAPLEKGDSDN